MPNIPRILDPSPLGLAVLAVLFERPSHPYDIQRTLRERGKDAVIDFKPAAVYRMVDRLVAAGLVEEVGTDREGKRPERTVYRLSEDGAETVVQWLREMLTKPRREFPLFTAAISFLPLLRPDDAASVLRMRVALLDGEIARIQSFIRTSTATRFPRLFLLEEELEQARLQGERDWVTAVVADLESGHLTWDHESLREMGTRLSGLATTRSALDESWR
ncbi:MAG: PadR family transcriptional regulator, partial [Solirubrobacteraceae bacterium]